MRKVSSFFGTKRDIIEQGLILSLIESLCLSIHHFVIDVLWYLEGCIYRQLYWVMGHQEQGQFDALPPLIEGEP